MTLKQVEYFQAVCRRGNISAAAEDLFVSRSVVSRAIADLEEEFGVPIFTRSKSGVALTESGRVLARFFTALTANYDAAKVRITQLQEGADAGPLRMGVTPTNAYCTYRTLLEPFMNQNPDVPLIIEEHSAYDAWKLLLDGSLDGFFTPAKPDPELFDSLELYPNPVMLGAAEDDPLVQKAPLSVEEIVALPLAFFNAPMPIEPLLTTCAQALGRKLNVALRTSDQMLLRELTQQGRIYPLLTLDMMATWEGVRQIPLNFFAPSTNRLVWSRALSPGRTMRMFLDSIRRLMAGTD